MEIILIIMIIIILIIIIIASLLFSDPTPRPSHASHRLARSRPGPRAGRPAVRRPARGAALAASAAPGAAAY